MEARAQGEWVDRMVVRCAGAEPLNVKLRLSGLFQGVDLHPAGLPPGAILKIRHLDDPLPGRIRVTGYAMFPPEDWRRAASAAVNEIARTTVRPYRTIVPAGARAVLFRDEAELVACMASASTRASPAAVVWWADSSRRADLRTVVLQQLLEAPRLIPAVVEYLAQSEGGIAWLGGLDTASVVRLAQGVVSAFALPAAWGDVTRRILEKLAVDPAPEWSTPVEREPWLPWVPEASAPELSKAAQFFVGWVLTVQRRPAEARSPAFATAVRAWMESLVRGEAKAPSSAPVVTESECVEPPAVFAPELAGEEHMAPEVSPRMAAPALEEAPRRAAPIAMQRGDTLAPIRTEYGGLFYLVNYAIYAGFYGDFTQPRFECLPLPIWDFIELLGKALLDENAAADPIWGLFAELSGREEDQPAGSGFNPPEGLEEWVKATARAARERLSLALQLQDPAELAGILIERHAVVYAGPANIDVVFVLAELPIAVRIAGLDRDPGWVPAAGRTIAFHFE